MGLEPDPLEVVGVAEERMAEARELEGVPGGVLRGLTNRALVCNLELRGSGLPGPPRWVGFLIALRLEREARKGRFGYHYAGPDGELS